MFNLVDAKCISDYFLNPLLTGCTFTNSEKVISSGSALFAKALTILGQTYDKLSKI